MTHFHIIVIHTPLNLVDVSCIIVYVRVREYNLLYIYDYWFEALHRYTFIHFILLTIKCIDCVCEENVKYYLFREEEDIRSSLYLNN